MQWHSKIYTSDNIRHKKDKLVKKINKKHTLDEIFCIYYSNDSQYIFAFISSNELNKDFVRSQDITLFGLAKGEQETIHLVCHILETMYRDTGNFKIRDYLEYEDEKFSK